jgi:hypothetical protein
MSPEDWIRDRKWRLRTLVAESWGDDAAATVSAVLDSYLSQAPEVARLFVEVRELRARLRQYEPAARTVVDPGPTWTGD